MRWPIGAIFFCLCWDIFAQTPPADVRDYERCLLDAIARAMPTATVAQIHARCRNHADHNPTAAGVEGDDDVGVVEQRIKAESAILNRPFALTAHRPNYFLPYTYNSRPNRETFRPQDPVDGIDSEEAQFQVSFKFPLAQRLLGQDNDLFFAFTSRSWWQVYNREFSSPFRETDYEPEVFLRHYGGRRLGRFKIAGWDLGLAHQSNGQSGVLSRSWNRLNANFAIETKRFALALRTWYRIPEDDEDDENPNLERYLGYGDLRLLYARRDQVYTAMVRPGTEKGALELTWSRPLWQQLRLYVKYFDGYGENLLDYDHRSRRLGIGIGLTDYLDARFDR